MPRPDWSAVRHLVVAVTMITFVEVTAFASSAPGGAAAERCTDTGESATSTLVLHLADRLGLAQRAREEMMRETIAPWQAAGVNVRWSMAAPAPASKGRTHVSIIITRNTGGDGRSVWPMRRRLASILFVDGKPTSLISAYPLEVERLLSVVRLNGETFDRFLPKMQHQLLGRALGRAVAHELGHFLFASADHAPFGLMRAMLPTGDLLAASHHALQVIAPPGTTEVVPSDCASVAPQEPSQANPKLN